MLYHWSCIVDFSAKLWNHSESTSLVPRYFPSSIIQLFTVCENDGGSPVIVYHINDINFNQCRQGGPKSFFSIPAQVLELWTVAKQKTYRSLTNYTHKVHLIFHSGSRMLDYGQMLCGAYHWHTLAATVTILIHFFFLNWPKAALTVQQFSALLQEYSPSSGKLLDSVCWSVCTVYNVNAQKFYSHLYSSYWTADMSTVKHLYSRHLSNRRCPHFPEL